MLLDIAENKLAKRKIHADSKKKGKGTKSERGETEHLQARHTTIGSEGIQPNTHSQEEYFPPISRIEPSRSALRPASQHEQ